MLLLEINEPKNRVLTLTEKMTVVNAPVLFEFKSLQTIKFSYCNSPDISPFPLKWNRYRFMPVSGQSPDQSNGEFTVDNSGQYIYKAYQMPNLGDFNPENAIRLLEVGFANILNDMTQKEAYNSTINRITYEKNV